jgi:transposase
LDSLQVAVVAMESTGVYGRAVFHLLEEGRRIILVNAQQRKAVPGRKTDIKDSEWIADVLRHGLLKASFIPPAPLREWRDLTRSRKTLIQDLKASLGSVERVKRDLPRKIEGSRLLLGVSRSSTRLEILLYLLLHVLLFT